MGPPRGSYESERKPPPALGAGRGSTDRWPYKSPRTKVLVLHKIAKASEISNVQIGDGFDFAKLAGDGRIAIGAVKSVPAGEYTKAALQKLGAGTRRQRSLQWRRTFVPRSHLLHVRKFRWVLFMKPMPKLSQNIVLRCRH